MPDSTSGAERDPASAAPTAAELEKRLIRLTDALNDLHGVAEALTVLAERAADAKGAATVHGRLDPPRPPAR